MNTTNRLVTSFAGVGDLDGDYATTGVGVPAVSLVGGSVDANFSSTFSASSSTFRGVSLRSTSTSGQGINSTFGGSASGATGLYAEAASGTLALSVSSTGSVAGTNASVRVVSTGAFMSLSTNNTAASQLSGPVVTEVTGNISGNGTAVAVSQNNKASTAAVNIELNGGSIDVVGNGVVVQQNGTGAINVLAGTSGKTAIKSAASGILATSTNGGAITINTGANVTATNGTGISASQTSTSANAANIAVTVADGTTVTASKTGTTGIATNLGISTGTASVTVDGTVDAAGTGISQTSVGGTNRVTVSATGKVDPLIGIDQTTASGVNIVDNSGVILGDNIGIRQTATGSGTNTVDNKAGGSITGTAQQAVLMTGTSGTQTLTNAGDIVGTNGQGVVIAGTTGSQAVTNTGTIAAAKDAVTMTSSSGALTFAGDGGKVSSGTNGIVMTSTKGGAITVNGSNDVEALDGVGITMTQSGSTAGKITLTTTGGTVQGTTAGISATTDGTGAIVLQPGGDVLASAGDAIVATNTNSVTGSGSIQVDVAAGTKVTGSNNGIATDAQLALGGTRINVAGDVTGTDGYGIFATSFNTQGNSLGINIQQTDPASTITGSLSGIRAEVLGYSGPITINTLGTVSATGSMDAGNTRAAISVQSDAVQGNPITITTNLVQANGLDGINVVRTNGGGQILITSNGQISSAGAPNNLQTGIRVLTQGDSSATVGITLNNSTIGSTSDRAQLNGILVNSADGAVNTKLVSGSIYSVGTAIDITQNSDTAGITVNGTGTGAIDSTKGDGIRTYLPGTATTNTIDPSGNTFIQVNQTINAGGTGINAKTEGSGSILINAINNITGGSDGVVLVNEGPVDNTGALTVTLSSGKAITALNGDGIRANANASVGGIKLTINGSGIISATGGDGIEALSNSTRGDIAINAAAASSITGETNGISAAVAGTGGNITINSLGTLTATSGSGINAVNNSQAVLDGITIVSNVINSSGGDGIYAQRDTTNGAISITSNGLISSGATSNTLLTGIYATNNGGGNTAITLNANIGTTADRAQSGGVIAIQSVDDAAGNIQINLNKTSIYTAGGPAVGAYQYGDGSISITETGTGTLSSTNGDGVVAQIINGGPANITLALTHDIAAGNNGLSALTDGSGNLTVTQLGNITATNGIGIWVENSNLFESTSAISVTTTAGKTLTSGGTAILTNANQATGGTVINGNNNLVSTSGDGINASSNSTDGDITITQATGTTINAVNGLGISAYAQSAGLVSVTNGAAITAANGILAESDSTDITGIDTVTVTNTGNITLGSGGNGIQAYRFNGDGNVSVTSSGTILGIAGGTFSTGIDAETGNGGNVTVVTTGNIGSASGNAVDHGVYATAFGSGTADNVSVTISGSSVWGGTTGISAQNNSATASLGGNVTVIGTGTGNISGATGTGIVAAQNVTDGAGNVSVNVTQAVTGFNGINAQTAGSGNVSVTTGGNVTGTNGLGIFAANTDTLANAGAITVTTAAGTTVDATGNGIWTQAGKATGGTTILSNSVINSASSNGIIATSASTNGDIQITSNGSSITALKGSAITANASGIGGAIDITSNSALTGVNGILASSSSTNATENVTITSNKAILATNVGIQATRSGSAGDILINSNGAISGNTSLVNGILATNSGGGDTTVNVNASIGLPANQLTGTGIRVDQTNATGTGNIAINLNNSSVYVNSAPAGGYGILALNSGLGGIDITGTGAGTITADNGFAAVRADITNTANSQDINISIQQDIQALNGSNGIFTRTFGTGDINVSTYGNIIDTNLNGWDNGIIAYYAGSSKASTTAITINTAAGKTIEGGQDGIWATASFASGGITVNSGSNIIGRANGGIFAYSNSLDGDILVNNTNGASISGNVWGIYAHADGTGSAVTVNTTGPVSASGGLGISAASNSTSALDNVTINSSGTIKATTIGIEAIRNGASGDIAINSNATISGNPALTNGIVATNNGGGRVLVAVKADIGATTATAIDLRQTNAAGTGIVSLTLSNASVTGGTGAGINLAQNGTGGISFVGTGSGAVTCSTGTALSSAVTGKAGGNTLLDFTQSLSCTNGVAASTNGTGNITVEARGNVTGTGGFGIAAVNSNTAANSGNIDVHNLSGMQVSANGGNGIITDLGLSNGTATVRVDGEVTAPGMTGVLQTAKTGSNLLVVSTTGKIDPIIGADQTTASGSNTVTNAGLIVGDTIGVRQTATTTGTDTVTNTGSIIGTANQGVLMRVADGNALFNGIGGTVTGGTSGLEIGSSGLGTITVNGSNDITGTSGAGVALAQTGKTGATITLSTTGGQIEGATGIFATTNGTGAISIQPGAIVTGTAGDGIVATNTGGGAGDITVATLAGQPVSATGSAASGAGIAGFADGTGAIQITGAGNVTGLNGIVTQTDTGAISIGGTGKTSANGGYAINASIVNVASTANLTVNRSGAMLGAVSVSNAGSGTVNLTVSDINATQIFTKAQGAANGIFTNATNGATVVTANGDVSASGVQANFCGTALTVSGQTVTANVQSAHGCANGISASAGTGGLTLNAGTAIGDTANGIVFNSTGPAVITTTGPVTGNATGTGTGSGILTVNNPGNVAINATGPVSGDGGMDLSTTAGTISVTGSGPVTGRTKTGLSAVSTTGSVSITSAGTITGATNGIIAVTGGAADVTVSGTGAVAAANGVGIYTQSGGGNVQVAPASTVVANGNGIVAITNANGTVSVTTVGATTAKGIGIGAIAETGSTKIVAAPVTVSGPGAVGIDASATTGSITVSTGAINGSANGQMATAVRTKTGGNTSIMLGAGTTSATNAATSAVIDASGTNAGNALTIDTTASSLFGATGIRAQSNGTFSITNIGITAANSAFDLSGSGTGTVVSNGAIVSNGPLVLIGTGTGVQFTNNGSMAGPGGLNQVLFSGAGAGNVAITNNGMLQGNILLNPAATNRIINAGNGVMITGTTINLGTCASCTLTNNGKLAPGASGTIQTTALTGNLAQGAAGTYFVDYNPTAGLADRINATGTANIGGTVAANLIGLNPNVSAGTTNTVIVEATQGVTVSGATLAGLSNTGARTYSLTQPNANQLAITSIVNFAPTGLTANQTGIGTAINTASTGAPFLPLANSLVQLANREELGRAYDQLSGEGLIAAQQAGFVREERFHSAIERQLILTAMGGKRSESRDGWALWMSGDAGQANFSGQAQTPGSANAKLTNYGLTGGIDHLVGNAGAIGVAMGYGSTDISVADRTTTGKQNGWSIGAYAAVGGMSGPYARVSVSYDQFSTSTSRTITIGGPSPLSARLGANFDARGLSARSELGYRIDLGGVQLTPFVGLHYSELTVDGFSETGSSLMGLTVSQQKAKSKPGIIGLQINTAPGSTAPVQFWLRGSYREDFERDRQLTGSFQSAPGVAFTVTGAGPARSYAQVSGGISYKVSGATELYVSGNLTAGGDATSMDGQAGIRIRF